jgi:hypothetical protein
MPSRRAFQLLIVLAFCALIVTLVSLDFTFRFRLHSSSVSYTLTFLCGLLFVPFVKHAFTKTTRVEDGADSDSLSPFLYGLDHGRLHLELPVPMWMNMGYWCVGPGFEVTVRDATT